MVSVISLFSGPRIFSTASGRVMPWTGAPLSWVM
jgi:hypothetical protein